MLVCLCRNDSKPLLVTSQPYGHKEIHHRADVAAQVDYFFRNGTFDHTK